MEKALKKLSLEEKRNKKVADKKLSLIKKKGQNHFVCNVCRYETNRTSNLKRHYEVMHSLMSAPEECCDLEFRTKSDLQMHNKKEHGDGYRCKYANCGKLFERRALLKRHFCVHTGEKRFLCNTCGYRTSNKSNLSRHCEKQNHTYEQLDEEVTRDNTSSRNVARPSQEECFSLPSLSVSSATSSPANNSAALTSSESSLPPSLKEKSHQEISVQSNAHHESTEDYKQHFKKRKLKYWNQRHSLECTKKEVIKPEPCSVSNQSLTPPSTDWVPFASVSPPMTKPTCCQGIAPSSTGQINHHTPESFSNQVFSNAHEFESKYYSPCSLMPEVFQTPSFDCNGGEQKTYTDLSCPNIPRVPYYPPPHHLFANGDPRNASMHHYPPIAPFAYCFPPPNINYMNYFSPFK